MISPLLRKSGKPWPWNTLIEPRPANWGIGMTVCIAAHNFLSKSVICATDSMISIGDMSADASARKWFAFGNHWVAMYAGNDISCATPIRGRIRKRIEDRNKESMDDVVEAFVLAYQEELKVKTENEILGPIGYTLQGFKSNGLKQLGAEAFSRIFYEVQQQAIDVTFLITGFDESTSDPYIFTVSSPGKVEHYEEVGFWAIGAGNTHALGSMFNAQRHIRLLDFSDALYRVCEAKFNAENAIGVGRITNIAILYEDGRRELLGNDDCNSLRPFWEATRVINVPADARKRAAELLAEAATRRIALNSAEPSQPSSSQSLTP